MSTVSIIVVTYNSEAEIRNCLSAASNCLDGCVDGITVVDNNSTDHTYDIIRQKFPAVEVLRNTHNKGFAVAVNIGLAATEGDYVLILNPDVSITPTAIYALRKALDEQSSYAAAGCQMTFANGVPQTSARSFPTLMSFFLRCIMTNNMMQRSTPQIHSGSDKNRCTVLTRVDWILGGCMLIRRKAFEDIGGFDEDYFLYYEDIDWCYRARLRNWNVGFYEGESVVHAYQRSSSRISILNPLMWIHLKSAFRFFTKFAKVRGVQTLA